MWVDYLSKELVFWNYDYLLLIAILCYIVNLLLLSFQEEYEYTKNLLRIIFGGETEEER
jgi:hypothetical protein